MDTFYVTIDDFILDEWYLHDSATRAMNPAGEHYENRKSNHTQEDYEQKRRI
jgi:hypothetical protein